MVDTHGDSGQQTLGYICHNDTNQEDDSIQPVVAQDESNDKEGHAQEHSHAGDDVDEMSNLPSNRGLSHL